MSYANLGPEDFEASLTRLRPRGLAWAAGLGGVLTGFWNTIADAVAALHARVGALTERESFPPFSFELLPDWETVLGLPDPCLGPNPLVSARQAAVMARLAATGGQSVPYYENVALNLGGTVTIQEFAPFRAGINRACQPLLPKAAAFWWEATVSTASLFFFRAGSDRAGQPLWQIGNDAIVCELERLAPAHTIVFFAVAPGQGGQFMPGQSQPGGPDLLQ